MRKDITIPDAIGSRIEYKRKFSIWEMYRSFILIPNAAAKMIINKRKKIVNKDFVERLQLAVTEVNGCAACSYAHTYMALKQGMSNEEINSFLSGDGAFINHDEAKAIIFAQHYADKRGFPKKVAYDSLVDEYGKLKVKIIISAIQLMHAGNIYGIPFSAIISRLKGKPYIASSLIYELGMHIGGLILFSISLIDGFLRGIMVFSKIRLDNRTTIE